MPNAFDIWNIAILYPANDGLLIAFDDLREFGG